MAERIVWSIPASEDLNEVIRHISKDSIQYAGEFLLETELCAKRLYPFPHRGRKVPEFNNPYIREIFLMNYRLIYKVQGKKILILALVHGARDLWNAWKERGAFQ